MKAMRKYRVHKARHRLQSKTKAVARCSRGTSAYHFFRKAHWCCGNGDMKSDAWKAEQARVSKAWQDADATTRLTYKNMAEAAKKR